MLAVERKTVREITPKLLRCAVAAACPGLHEVSPTELRCHISECPSLHELPPLSGFEDGGVIVIGKVHDVTALVAHRIGEGEAAVLVPKALLQNIQWKD